MLTLGIIAKHGAASFRRLIDSALPHVDEVIVALDVGHEDGLCGYRDDRVLYFERPLNMDFAAQRNAVCERVTKDWVLFLDTDENLGPWLWDNLRGLLPGHADLVMLPRRNDMEGVGTLMNWPDWQPKLHRNHVRWERPVHEWPVGFNGVFTFPAEEKYAILHFKTPEQQDVANKLYERILSGANPN